MCCEIDLLYTVINTVIIKEFYQSKESVEDRRPVVFCLYLCCYFYGKGMFT